MNKLDENAIKALKQLREYCDTHYDCEKCIFYETDPYLEGCMLECIDDFRDYTDWLYKEKRWNN